MKALTKEVLMQMSKIEKIEQFHNSIKLKNKLEISIRFHKNKLNLLQQWQDNLKNKSEIQNKWLKFKEVGFHLEIRPYLIVWGNQQTISNMLIFQKMMFKQV